MPIPGNPFIMTNLASLTRQIIRYKSVFLPTKSSTLAGIRLKIYLGDASLGIPAGISIEALQIWELRKSLAINNSNLAYS